MSFGYLIFTDKKCDFLKQKRFKLLTNENGIYSYFLPFEGFVLFTDRLNENNISLTSEGLDLFKQILDVTEMPFYFSYFLLRNREGEADFEQEIRKSIIKKSKFNEIVSGQEKISLREIYLVKDKK